MDAFVVTWRSARQFREFEHFADAEIGELIWSALEVSRGLEAWQAGTIWKCPGCGDRTIKSEEFLEGLRLAEQRLQVLVASEFSTPGLCAALKWTETLLLQMFGCERDRVYIKDTGGDCRFARETYISRI
jgi:hypothetical protein